MERRTRSFNFFYLVVLLVLAMAFIYMAFSKTGNTGEAISANEAISLINEEKVSNVWYQGGNFRLKLKTNSTVADESTFPYNADYHFTVGSQTEFDMVIEASYEKGAIVTFDEVVDYWSYVMPVLYVLGFGLLIFIFFRMMNKSNSSAMTFGRSKARQSNNVKVRFTDIAGADEEKEELAEIVEFLKNPKKFTALGARIPKGVLLVGNPGTGKTLLARAVAGESNCTFLSISGSDFVEMFVGVGASRVRDLFDQAKHSAPCIVFIDEIDAVGRQRGAGLGGGNDEREQTLNALLVEMDGFESNEGIIVLAATNRSDVLDPALMRPGRFDRQIYVHTPDVRGREGILRIHAKNKPLDDDIDFKTLARITTGFTGADLENMLNEAAILAARNGRAKIIMEDITEGINKVIMGPQKKSMLVTDRDKKITAYHESGHAILGKNLEHCEEVQEVSIIPRGSAGGYTMSRPVNDDNYMTLGKLNDEIAMMMGGRIAEELFMDDITTGASNDIQKATQLARKMVTDWGMSEKFKFMNLGSSTEIFIGRDYQTKNEYSDKTSSEIDIEVQKILKYNYDRAKEILQKNKNALSTMAEVLLEKQTIYTDEVNLIIEGKSKDEILEIIKQKQEEQKIKEQERSAERELEAKLAQQEQRVKSGEFYLKNGKITQADFNKIVEAKEEIEKKLNELKNKKDNGDKKDEEEN